MVRVPAEAVKVVNPRTRSFIPAGAVRGSTVAVARAAQLAAHAKRAVTMGV